jgi:hypothetical protein
MIFPTEHIMELGRQKAAAIAERDALTARLAECEKDCEEAVTLAVTERDRADALASQLAEAHQLLQDALIYGCDGQWAKRLDAHLGAADSADDDPYRRAAQQSLDARREGMARARADGTAERAVDDLLKILGK